jgi:hypothetical protein
LYWFLRFSYLFLHCNAVNWWPFSCIVPITPYQNFKLLVIFSAFSLSWQMPIRAMVLSWSHLSFVLDVDKLSFPKKRSIIKQVDYW